MNLKRLYIVGVVMLAASCTNVDSFNSPYMLEGFTGIVKVTPGIEGITANSYTPGLIFFNSNKQGTETVMYGPATSNISLYSILPDDQASKDKFRTHMELQGVSRMDKLDFSGFRARVDKNNPKKINVYDFASSSKGMEIFKWKVEGTGIIDGPDSHVTIRISTTVGVLQDVLPTDLLDELSVPGSNVSLSQLEEKNTVVYLAQIDVLGESITPY